jgi:hypothetical protein
LPMLACSWVLSAALRGAAAGFISFVVVDPLVKGAALVIAGFSVSVEVGRCVLAGEFAGFCVLGGVAGFHIVFLSWG